MKQILCSKTGYKSKALVLVKLCLALSALVPSALATTRIKDITNYQAVRENQLVGYGLVIGLAATGDSLKSSPFTDQSMRSMLSRLGVNIEAGAMKSKNVAAVVVTANFPAFIKAGERIDVTVSSIGDASSLAGGQLILTPLVGADGEAYAVAQGPVSVSAVSAEGAAEKITIGVATGGHIANGALVERELEGEFNELQNIALQIRNPDFATVIKIAEKINIFALKKYTQKIATAKNYRTITLSKPANITLSQLVADVGELQVETDTPARIVIDEKTGTIVIGENVKLSKIAVTHGNLTVRISENPGASQPYPDSLGETVILPATDIGIQQKEGRMAVIEGPDLQTLVNGLNQIGLKPQGIIAILQSIKAAGALQGELIVQ